MFIVRLIILVLLAVVLFQDLKSRSVLWVIFPLLSIVLIINRILQHETNGTIVVATGYNLIFLFLQLILLTLYFSARNKKWINITEGMLGWGDILFLAVIAVYCSTLNFILFYIVSLILVVMIWMALQVFSQTSRQVPLAGLQAAMFTLLLVTDWFWMHLNINSDFWIEKLFFLR